jgi:hypothetical protein
MLAAPVPRALLETVFERVAILAYAHDVEQDFVIWQHKTYLEKPALAVYVDSTRSKHTEVQIDGIDMLRAETKLGSIKVIQPPAAPVPPRSNG